MRYDDLSLREKAAQLIFPRIGSNMPPPVTVQEDLARVEALLERCPVGGLVLFNGSYPELPGMLGALQQRCRVPLLVATDMERGVGQQVRGATVFPHAMAFAASEGGEAEAVLERAARVQAREALACGIHVTFAPVADVNRNPRNPIIATRALGTEPEQAARLVQAYIRGCRAEGLLSTAKHFPGHGNTSQDSHAELPYVSESRERLARTDLVPFRAAINAGVDLVMTAHVAYPAFDASEVPATLSRPILHDLLRGDLGFRGAVVTDSLLMGAVRDRFPDAGAQAVALVRAGADILLDVAEPEAAVQGLVQAVERGELDEGLIDAAARRVWACKQKLIDRFGADIFFDPAAALGGDEGGVEVVGSEAHRQLAQKVAARAVRVVAAADGVLPIDPASAAEGGLQVVLVKPHRTRLDPPEEPLGRFVRAHYPRAFYHEVGPETTELVFHSLLKQAAEVRHAVVAIVVKPAAWHAFGLLPAQQQFVETLAALRPVVLASLGSPYVLDDVPHAAARLCTYSDVEASQRALADALSR